MNWKRHGRKQSTVITASACRGRGKATKIKHLKMGVNPPPKALSRDKLNLRQQAMFNAAYSSNYEFSHNHSFVILMTTCRKLLC
jgi:hypothetical protein